MNLKTGGIAAAFGFVLSLIIGLVFGNGVFALLRALAFALFFFVLTNAILFVIRRFLPELLDASPEPADSRPGSLVNIVEGGETANSPDMGADIESLDFRQAPDDRDGGSAIEPDLSGERFSDGNSPGGDFPGPGIAPVDPGVMPENPAAPGGNSSVDPLSPPSLDGAEKALDLAGKDSYNEERSVSGEGAGFRADEAFSGAGLSPLEAQPPPAAKAESAVHPKDGASTDILPDFETMSRAFLAQDGEAGDGAADQGDDIFHLSVAGQSPEPSPQYYKGNKPVKLEGDFPPQKIAQAIQTVLKRDE
jgi:hypothetical protein